VKGLATKVHDVHATPVQVVVSLLEALQEGQNRGVAVAACRVLEELVLCCRRDHRNALAAVPPLPNWLPELQRLNEVG
jgi:hypothetical protein